MATLEIRKYPDPVLREVSLPVTVIDAKTRKLAGDMIETMLAANGVGLAASQVGVPIRLAVVDFDPERHDPRVLINPFIAKRFGRRELREEGCLSFPDLRSQVKRNPRLLCQAQDLQGRVQEYEVQDLTARAVQHELDHLDGLLFVDKVGPSDRQSLRRDLEEMEQGYAALHPGG